jgi:RNA polymerase sigma-70 factor (ECF subfamily)
MNRLPDTAAASEWREIIRRAQRFEPDAFDAIVDQYAGRLFGFFQRMLGRREAAEDLVQEVFMRLVKMIGEYREEGRFEAWLFRLAGNLARDRLRRHALAPLVDSLDAGPKEEGRVRRLDGTSPEAAPLTGGADDFTRDRLQQAFARLPDAEREVILLRHFGQLGFAEIAEYTATPLGTVLSRAHRGLAKLREWMESMP